MYNKIANISENAGKFNVNVKEWLFFCLKTTENCCTKITEELKEDAKLYLAQAKTCIADIAKKCAKSATDCRKEAKIADKARDRVMEDARKSQKSKNLGTEKSNKTKNV